MAAATEYLQNQGLTLSVENERLTVYPGRLLNDTIRDFIRKHKAEIMAQLAANDEAPPATGERRAIVTYYLQDGKGGVLIDQHGVVSAVRTLWETYGQRLDWPDLLERFEERAAIMEHDGGLQRLEAEQEALRLIRACMKVNYPHENI